MQIVTLDFETYFDDEYSLKKMTTEAYVRDSRFKVLGCGIRWPDGQQSWHNPEQTDRQLRKLVPAYGCAVLAHHAHFDGLILSHHYGIKPAAWLDTLSMGRLLLGNHLSVSLESLARHFNLQAKNVPYELFKGKQWHELTPAVQKQVANGCLHDVELTWQIFNLLAAQMPPEEYSVIDMTVRMFTEPTLQGDQALLGQVWMDERDRKQAALENLGVTPAALQSADKFADLLRAEGIEPETKAGKNGPIYAFAKTDSFMKDLLESDDERVQTLAGARLGLKSTGEQTRAERLGDMSMRGDMCVYLSYCGAHTTRWSGGDAVNFQNFKRGGRIRKALKAPKGYRIIKADKSQIEARLLDFVAGQEDSVENFRAGRDPYVGTAGAFYKENVSPDDKPKRNFGKVIKLAAGFGMGWRRLQILCRQGPMGAPPIILTDEESQRGIEAYRRTHPFVEALWKDAEFAPFHFQ